ncbi:hypothetical protein Tco_1215314 [Tanacetum coccineum]
MGNEHLSTFSTKEIIPIPRESEETSMIYNKNDLPLCDDFSSIKDPRDDSDSYNSNLDESTFLVTPLSDSNKDECLTPGDDIEFLLHHDPSTPLKSVILEGFINDPPFEENDDLFDLECKMNDWNRILYDAPIDEAECFDPGSDNDEIDTFLAVKVPMYIEGYLKNFIRSFKMSFHNGGFYDGSIFSFSNTILFRCVGRGKVLRNPFFITEVDEDAIPEFSTIVNSELFDFDVILIFNSFDRHDSFR